jgi:hypothetical protein
MFERIGHSAEQCATTLARRAFFVKGGRWARAMAGALGAVLATRSKAYAGPGRCCRSQDGSLCWANRGRGGCPRGMRPVPQVNCNESNPPCSWDASSPASEL